MLKFFLFILMGVPLLSQGQIELLVGVDAKACVEHYENAGLSTDMASLIAGQVSLLAENNQFEVYTKFDEQGMALKAYVVSKNLVAFNSLIKQFIPWMQVGKHKFPSYEDRSYAASAFWGESEFPTIIYAWYNTEHIRNVGLELKDKNCDWQIVRDFQNPELTKEATSSKEQAPEQLRKEEAKLKFEKELDSQVFTNPEIMPYYKECENAEGGKEQCTNQKLLKFISTFIEYPEIARENSLQGTVYIGFVVDKTGNITNPKILRGIHPALDQEALRLVKKLPKMEPGTMHGHPISVQYNIPIRFLLQ
ncbi:MAG: energy transducer TonB [Flavobacteriales bacterium]